jgi:hypothetical protein
MYSRDESFHMTMDQISALIGEPVDSETVQVLVASAKFVASSETDLDEGVPLRHYLSCHRDGYVLTHVLGRVTTAHLFLQAKDEYRPFRGALVSGLAPRSTRTEVRDRLGRPSRSGEARTMPILGRHGPWDRYDGERFCTHFQYTEPDDCLQLVTIVVTDIAP